METNAHTMQSLAAGFSEGAATDYIAIGFRIRACRKQAGMTQATLSKAVDISISFMGHIERGARIPSVETLLRIANVLGTSVDALLTGRSASTPKSTNMAVRIRMLNDIMRVLNDNADEWLRVE